MAESQRESPAPPEISDAEVHNALQRTERERVGTKPTETEENLLIAAIEQLPREGRILQMHLKRQMKKNDAPQLIEAQRRALVPISFALQKLKTDPQREQFRSEELSATAKKYYRTNYLQQIDAMLDQSQREGLVAIWGGRLCNRIGYVGAWINQLTDMLEGPVDPISKKRQGSLLTQGQRDYVQKVLAFFEQVKNGDRQWAQEYDRIQAAIPPESNTVRKGKGAMRMLGLLAIGGFALTSTLLDLKDGRLSPYTMAWLGLTGYTSGLFTGHDRTVRNQLKFITTKEWEQLRNSLNIQGEQGTEFIRSFLRAHRGSTARGRKAREILKSGRQSGQVPKDEYIRAIVGENPQGQDAYMEKLLKNLTPSQLYLLGSSLSGVTDSTAKALLKDFVRYNIDSQSVTQDLKENKKGQISVPGTSESASAGTPSSGEPSPAPPRTDEPPAPASPSSPATSSVLKTK